MNPNKKYLVRIRPGAYTEMDEEEFQQWEKDSLIVSSIVFILALVLITAIAYAALR